MPYKIVLLLPVTMICLFACAQRNFTSTRKHSIYAELGGSGWQYSVNYELLYNQELAVRAGIEVLPNISGNIRTRFIGFPVGYSVLFGKGSSKFEAGGGVLFGFLHTSFPYYGYETNDFVFALTTALGYRYQLPAGGFMFRAGISPIYSFRNYNYPFFDKGLSLTPAISFGYTF